MKIGFSLLALLVFGACTRGEQAASAPVQKEHPTRIVALAPSLAEVVAALDPAEARTRLIGVSEHSVDPAWIKAVESIGPFHRFSVEKVFSLRPDLVIATKDGNSEEQVDQLRSLGIRVLVVETSSLEEWLRSLETVGRAIGAEASATALVRESRAALQELQKRAPQIARTFPHALFLLSVDPWIVPGAGTLLFDALSAAGLDLRISGAPARVAYPKYSREAVFSTQWNLVLHVPGQLGEADVQGFRRMGADVRTYEPESILIPGSAFAKKLLAFQGGLLAQKGGSRAR